MRAKKTCATLLALLTATAAIVAAIQSAARYWPFREPGQPASVSLDSIRLDEVRSGKKGLRVLFVGNSFSACGDLPELVRQLAEADQADPPLLYVKELPGSYRLQDHCEQGRVAELLEEIRWDFVVLQEQSQAPSFSSWQRAREMHPYVRELVAKIRAAGARPVLFMTWGYKDGDRMNWQADSYAAMQRRLQDGYVDIASELTVPVAPVGVAWEHALKLRPDLDLWEGDGVHAGLNGAYLAACVFYQLFYDKDSLGNRFTADLDAGEARFLQQAAATVMQQKRWGHGGAKIR